ncbi:hypothetical protein ACZ11_04425 [Lysinibacillus xylanilyticus]|uniref:DUF6630 domain-containing protein n=1 Tax=Lysinibacillus xylanilyticus TaxID=582475 RepID=A0A0K9FB98_9BACI|nr:hypothetical protein [Lysinibacillus xylanilyticus]KMY31487.1 hypothetical protein ACZ11_04425 [Lysinibacillus xylanilyticus]
MSDENIVPLIFEDNDDLKVIFNNSKMQSIYTSVLEHGMLTKKFLYLDYKGEENYEIVNYILDYEFDKNIELASQEELEKLGEYEYEFLPEKVKEVNKVISSKGYGLFSYPTTGDFYALFIAKLENKKELLQVELLEDEYIPHKERFIQYFY